MFNKKQNKDIKELQLRVNRLSRRLDDLINQLDPHEIEEEEILVRVPSEIYEKIQDYIEEDIVIVGLA